VTNAPFPALVVGFFLIGFAMGFTVALGSLFCGTLQNATFAMGVLHGCYGVGGTVGPLVATALVNAAGEREWSKFYFLTQALAICTAGFGCWAFWSYEREQSSMHEASARLRGDTTDAAETASVQAAKLTGMFTALASRVVLLGAIFIFAYQGAEVSISGWVISFLITTRDGNPANVGYVTAGFWAGITLGRFLLTAPAQRIGEKTFVYFLVGGAIIFQALVWSVPNVIGDAVAVSLVGLLLGPVYPCAATVFMRSLSRKERLNGMGVISAFGSSGGAAAPFTTGIIAQAVGTFVLHPIAIALFGVMLGCWFCLPDSRKRRE
jgi:fucose permease